jgi:hypothetical protein
MRAETAAIMTPLPRNVIAAPIMGRPCLSGKLARSAKFQQNQGMCRGHAVCTRPIHYDRSGGLGGSTGGGEVSGASAPSAGGAAPSDAGDTSVAARFRYSASFSTVQGSSIQKSVNLGQDLAGLVSDVCARIVRPLARQIDRVAMDYSPGSFPAPP